MTKRTYERLRQFTQQQERERAAKEAAENERLVQVGPLRRRNEKRCSWGFVTLLLGSLLVPQVAGVTAFWLGIGAAGGLFLGYVLTDPPRGPKGGK